MVILTIALVSMAELMAITLRMQQLGRNQTAAIRLAQDKIDELTTATFAHASMQCGGNLAADEANYNDDAYDEDDDDANLEDRGYHRRWLVAAAPDGANLRLVTVRVIPESTDRRISSPFELTTIIRGVGAGCP